MMRLARRRPWVYLADGVVVGLFPASGVYRGKTVLVNGERCRITRVDEKRQRVKVKPNPVGPFA